MIGLFYHYLLAAYDVDAGMQSARVGHSVSDFYAIEVVDTLVGYA